MFFSFSTPKIQRNTWRCYLREPRRCDYIKLPSWRYSNPRDSMVQRCKSRRTLRHHWHLQWWHGAQDIQHQAWGHRRLHVHREEWWRANQPHSKGYSCRCVNSSLWINVDSNLHHWILFVFLWINLFSFLVFNIFYSITTLKYNLVECFIKFCVFFC